MVLAVRTVPRAVLALSALLVMTPGLARAQAADAGVPGPTAHAAVDAGVEAGADAQGVTDAAEPRTGGEMPHDGGVPEASPPAPGTTVPETAGTPAALPPTAAAAHGEPQPPTVKAPPAAGPTIGAMPEPSPSTDDGAASAPRDEEEIVVVGAPPSHTAGSVHVVSEAELGRHSYDDPHAALASVPGVYTRGEDGVGLRPNVGLRGVNPDRSKKATLMEDGVLLGPAPYSAPAAYYFPVMSRMTGIRVIKGPGAITSGPQTVGGAIDLVTRPVPYETAGAVDLAFGEYLYRRGHGYIGSDEGPLGVLVEGVHLASDGFKVLPSGGDTGFYRNEFMVKASYDVSDDSELRLKLTYSDELSNETYLGLSDADFEADPLQRYEVSKLDRMRNHRISGVLSHTVHLGDHVTIDSDLYRHDFHRIWRKVNRFGGTNLFSVLSEPDTPRNAVFLSLLRGESDTVGAQETLFIGPNERDFTSQGVQTRLRLELATQPLEHNIEVGMRLHHDRIERRHSEEGFEIIEGDLFPDGGPLMTTALNEASSHALALHATDAIAWHDLTIAPGVRLEVIRSSYQDRMSDARSDRWAHAVLPGVGAHYEIIDNLGILAGVYRGFSPPPPGSDDDIEPELSVNYEAGARFDAWPVHVELIGFFNDYANLTDICTYSTGCSVADVDRQFDAGNAHVYGLEAYLRVAPSLGDVTLPAMATYTLTHAEFRRSFESDDPIFGEVARGDEMPYVPRHQLRGSLGLDHRRGGGDVSLTYVSPMRELAGTGPLDETLATDPQLLLDAMVRVRVLEQLEVYLRARNLLDSANLVSRRPFGARPNAPRWLQIGLKAEL